MTRKRRTSAMIALCCAVVGVALVGCEDEPSASSDASASPSATSSPTKQADDDKGADGKGADDKGALQGSEKIDVAGQSVNVSCSGQPAKGQPVVMLLHGGGHGVKELAGFQRTLSEKHRVCSYDRLGAGASDKPKEPQTITDSGKVLSGVLEKVAADHPVVLAGHSLGGLIAARYAPDHQDRVKGLVLLDATSPTQTADLTKDVPRSTKGPEAEIRDQMIAVLQGQNPEKLVVPDGKVSSAGDIPAEVLQHGKQYLAEQFPEHGKAMERSWTEGQNKWLAVSSRSGQGTAEKSGHDIHLEQPDFAAKAVERVVTQVAARS